jgi:hypothetical protein
MAVTMNIAVFWVVTLPVQRKPNVLKEHITSSVSQPRNQADHLLLLVFCMVAAISTSELHCVTPQNTMLFIFLFLLNPFILL